MFYDNYVKLCNSIGKSPSAVVEELGYKKSTVTRWKKGGKPTDATARKIADYFGVDIYNLLKDGMRLCSDCNYFYSGELSDDVANHQSRHEKWRGAKEKFKIWNSKEREERYEYEQIEKDPSNSFEIRIEAAKKLIFAYFSRSVEDSDFNLSHIPFEDYIPYFLYSQKHVFSPDIYEALAAKYGSKPGMSGTRWDCDKIRKSSDKKSEPQQNPDIRMIARAGRKMTPEQAENLRKYAQYMYPEAFEDDDT